MADTPTGLEDDRFILAGEYALGVLEGEELAEARRLMLSDREFAEAVDWWGYRLGAMAEAVEAFDMPPAVLRSINARIDGIEKMGGATPVSIADRRPSQWSIAALVAGAGLAVAGLVFFVSAPGTTDIPERPATSATAGPQLIAQLQDEETARKLAGVIDVRGNRLALNISGLEAEAGQTPELWVIPEGGAPVSLGAIPESGSFDRSLSSEEARLLVPGSTLAVTFEEKTGERHVAPTMPILLAGSLDQV